MAQMCLILVLLLRLVERILFRSELCIKKVRAKICSYLESQCPDTALDRSRLLVKLVSLNLEQFSSVQRYVAAIMGTAQQLSDLDKRVDDGILAALLLHGLTPNLKLSIESNMELSTEYVLKKLLQANKQTAEPPAWAALGGFGLMKNDWLLDSGCSRHVSRHQDWFIQWWVSPSPVNVVCADGKAMIGERVGTMELEAENGVVLPVHDVAFIPGVAANLLSVNVLTNLGYTIVFTNKDCKMYRSNDCAIYGNAVLRGVAELGVYKIKPHWQNSASSMQLMKWNQRLGHFGLEVLKALRENYCSEVSFPNTMKFEAVSYIRGLKSLHPRGKVDQDAVELIHSSLSGPISENSFSSYKYLLTYIDEFTDKTFICYIHTKSDIIEKFLDFIIFVECETRDQVIIDRSQSDIISEGCNSLPEYCRDKNMHYQFTEINEAFTALANKSLLDITKAMVEGLDLSRYGWNDLVNSVTRVEKWQVTKPQDNSPVVAWTGDLCYTRKLSMQLTPDVDKEPSTPIHVQYLEATGEYHVLN